MSIFDRLARGERIPIPKTEGNSIPADFPPGTKCVMGKDCPYEPIFKYAHNNEWVPCCPMCLERDLDEN